MFPALHIGAHHGPVLYRDGDYVGRGVNLAARIASAAARDESVVGREEGVPWMVRRYRARE
jgi:adenylate cyclase